MGMTQVLLPGCLTHYVSCFLVFFSFLVWLDTQVLFGEPLGKAVTGLVRQSRKAVVDIGEGMGMVEVEWMDHMMQTMMNMYAAKQHPKES